MTSARIGGVAATCAGVAVVLGACVATSSSTGHPPARSMQPPLPATVSASTGPWVLWFRYRDERRAVDPETGAVVELAGDPVPSAPPVEVTIDGERFTSSGSAPIPSPDGHHLAWELFGSGFRVVWTRSDRSEPLVVAPTGNDTCWPTWSPDGTRLLVATRDDRFSGEYRLVVHELATRTETPHHDQAVLPSTLVLVDGNRWLHVRRRRDEGRLVFDLAEVEFATGAPPEVIAAYVPEARQLLVSPDHTIVWLCASDDSLWRYDRRTHQLTHSWLRGELLTSRSPFSAGSFRLRPDGDAVAAELHRAVDDHGWWRGGSLGTAVITVGRASNVATVRRIAPDVAQGLRGFVPVAAVTGEHPR